MTRPFIVANQPSPFGALISPQNVWWLGLQTGAGGSLANASQIACYFGVFQSPASTPNPSWYWQAISPSVDIASATISFSSGSQLQLIVDWRNGTNNSVAWSSDTNNSVQAVALTDDGQLLLLDSQNHTVWQARSQNALAPCPSDLCLSSPPSALAPAPSGATSLHSSLALITVSMLSLLILS